MVYYWLKMVNQGLGVESNQFSVILRTFRISTKSGPLNPLFITKTVYKIQEEPKSFSEDIMLHISEFWISQNFGFFHRDWLWGVGKTRLQKHRTLEADKETRLRL